MSEQVGASLVLAQIFAPLQTPPQTQGAPGSTLQDSSPTASTGFENGTQAIVFNEDSPDIFASLLNELATLEVQSAEDPHSVAEALIRVRVDTAPRAESALQGAAGNGLPGIGTILPVEGSISATVDGAIDPEVDPSMAAAIVIKEPQVEEPMSRLGSLAADEANRVPAPTETSRTAPVNPAPGPTPGNEGAIAPPSVDQASDSRTQQRLQPSSMLEVDTSVMMDAAESDAGDESSQHGRQDQPRPPATPATGRSPSISFSHDGSLAATIANGITQTPSAQAGLASMPGSPGAQPALTLLGAPANWAEPLAERLASFASRGTNTAEVKLHPPSLGALEIRITVNNDQASLWVSSANADVRDALQQSLPRLESLLDSLGIELADSEIADRQTREFASEGERENGSQDGDTAEREDVSADPAARLGLIDTWA